MNYSIRYTYADMTQLGNKKKLSGSRVITAFDDSAADRIARDVMLPDLVRITPHVKGSLTITEVIALG